MDKSSRENSPRPSNIESPLPAAASSDKHAVRYASGRSGPQLTGRRLICVWLISLGIHTLVLFILFHQGWFPDRDAVDDDLPVALTDLVGKLTSADLSISKTPDLTEFVKDANPSELRFEPTQFHQVSQATTPRKAPLPVVGIGTGGADFSKYGLTSGGASGPTFFNTGGAQARGARRIVYVVDRSGSMIDTFDMVVEELIESVQGLGRSQKFHVMFFNTGAPVENPPRRLVSAIGSQKKAFFEFLQSDAVLPQGSTDPHDAMSRAFQLKPDLIFFLTDGEFDPALLAQLEQWNKDRQVKIFTIAYFNREGAALLEKIAREHGGTFRYVSEDDLP